MAKETTDDSFLFIADLHSLTQIKKGDILRENTFSTAASWLACGLDTEKTHAAPSKISSLELKCDTGSRLS